MNCPNCGADFAEGGVCPKCGTLADADGQQPSQIENQQPSPLAGVQGPERTGGSGTHQGGFIPAMNSFANSTLFLLGIILFTAGTAVEIVKSFLAWNGAFSTTMPGMITKVLAYSVWGLLSVILPLLVIASFWLLFAAAKTGKQETSYPAFPLLKINLTAAMIVSCLGAFLLFYGSILYWRGSGSINYAYYELLMLVFAAVLVGFLITYYTSALSVVENIRSGVEFNSLTAIPNGTKFSMLALAIVAYFVVYAIAVAGGPFVAKLADIMAIIDEDGPGWLDVFVNAYSAKVFGALVDALVPLIKGAGVVLAVITLQQFERKLPIANN
jgi:hypothetical protein